MPLKSMIDGLSDLPRSTDETRDANLIRATTDLYVQDATHDRDQNRRYEELATHFLPKIAAVDRAYVSERLAGRRDAPAAVIRMLARDVIDVAAPILSTSPVLDTLTLLSTIAATGAEHHRMIARRRELPEPVKRALRLTGDAEVILAIDREPPAAAPTAETAEAGAMRHGPGALREAQGDGRRFLELSRRDRLAVLVGFATRPAASPRTGAAGRLDRAFRSILNAAKIVGFARAGQRDQVVAAIAEGLDLGSDFVAACLDDPGGEAIAILVKALRLDSVQAQQVFLLMTPAGRDTNLFFPLADLYAGMEAGVAESIADAWRTGVASHPTHVPHVAGDDVSRVAARGETRIAPAAPMQERAKRA
jgi:uncharacterized protein (DUF2336 family)